METITTEETYTDEDFDTTMFEMLNISYMVVLSGICVLGITGNGLVIWFVAFRMKKTVNSLCFLSLALANFTFCLFLPLSVTYIALGNHWPFGTFMCKLNFLILYLNLSASVLQLTIISIDRCISVVFPVWCQSHRTVRLAAKVVLTVWIVSLLLNVPYFINTHVEEDDDNFLVCSKEWSMQSAQIIIRCIVLFVIPFTIIIFCYTLIFLRVQRNLGATSTKPFKVIASVIISFFICWLPIHVFSILYLYENNTWGHHFRLVTFIGANISALMAYSNSCVNPLLYVFVGQDFKGTFWSAIKSEFERAFTEDAKLTDPKRRTVLPDHVISQV